MCLKCATGHLPLLKYLYNICLNSVTNLSQTPRKDHKNQHVFIISDIFIYHCCTIEIYVGHTWYGFFLATMATECSVQCPEKQHCFIKISTSSQCFYLYLKVISNPLH